MSKEDKENDAKRPPRPSASRGRSHLRNTTAASIRTLDTVSSNSVTSSQSIGSGTSYTPEDIDFTPQRGSRSTSRSRSKDSTTKLENAPQKSVRTQSKQYVIRKSDENSSRAHGRERRGRSTSKPRGQERGGGSNASTRSNSRPRGNENALPRHPRSRSISSYSHKNRARSVSQTRSVRSARSTRSGASSLGTMEIEPNVHHNAILTTAIECPVIAEMKENELFARKNGINFTKDGGDVLTIVAPSEDNMLIQDDNFIENLQFSPTHRGKKGPGSEGGAFPYDGEDLPPNATFLRRAEKGGHMIESDADFAQLRMVAGQLCIDWNKKEFAPAIARRICDFQFAQEKRRKKFGNERPWGILGLYDHLSAVRMDVEWAEVAACRRANGEPYKAWFEFVDEKGTGKNRPFFTIIIMSICAGFMLASIAVNGWTVEAFSVNPMIGPSADTLVALGAKESLLIVSYGEVWRILSAMVLHAGFVHFALNMLAMWFVGSAIEKSHGFASSMLLFIAPAIGGTILSAIFLPEMISVGASGGIFGLIGACVADICLNWGLLFNNFVNGDNKHKHTFVLFALLLDVIVNSVIGLTPFVDNFTHLGGMIFGFLCGTSTMQRISTDMFESNSEITWWSSTKKNTLRFIGIIISLTAMCISFFILMRGDGMTTPCNACKAISCVTFPPWASQDDKWWYCDDCGSVTAEARINPDTLLFDQVSLQCPTGDLHTIPIQDGMSSDKEWLEGKLPTWCRLHC